MGIPQAAAEGGSSATPLDLWEIFLALIAFAVLCAIVLSFPPYLQEPDDYAYRASIIALTHGYPLTLTTAQVHTLFRELHSGIGPAFSQWIRLPGGRWISEKNPGYQFLAAPFQLLGIIRLAPLFYGSLGCLGLFFGARSWLGRFGGTAAVALFCSSGATLLFAWRDYMPTFTDASLIAGGTGTLLWAVLAVDAATGRRTWVGLLGFLALEAAVFARYTDILVLGCIVVAVVFVWRVRETKLRASTLGCWLASVALSGFCIAAFDDVVYGGPLKSGYPPGQVTFSLASADSNLRLMPQHLIQALPMSLLGLAALVCIAAQWLGMRRADGARAHLSRRDLAVGSILATTWFGVWGLYAFDTSTAAGTYVTVQVVRYYVPALGAISLLGAWLAIRVSRQGFTAAVASATVVVMLLGLGVRSFTDMRGFTLPHVPGSVHASVRR